MVCWIGWKRGEMMESEERIIDLPTVYDVLIDLSKEHKRFKRVGKNKSGYTDLLKLDLESRTITNGNIIIMKNGEMVVDEVRTSDGRTYVLKDKPLIELDEQKNTYDTLEELYHQYKYSVPNKNNRYLPTVFKAIPDEELSFEQMINNMQRNEANYRLSAFIMFASILGKLPWYNRGHWYWQSQNDKDLILYRKWVIGE